MFVYPMSKMDVEKGRGEDGRGKQEEKTCVHSVHVRITSDSHACMAQLSS